MRILQVLFTLSAACILMTLLLLVCCRDASLHFKGVDPDADCFLPSAIFTRLYFSGTTLTTTGFGDIVPLSRSARVITLSCLALTTAVVIGMY